MTKTRERDRLQTRDGDRCLLHAAAKYGQVRELVTDYQQFKKEISTILILI